MITETDVYDLCEPGIWTMVLPNSIAEYFTWCSSIRIFKIKYVSENLAHCFVIIIQRSLPIPTLFLCRHVHRPMKYGSLFSKGSSVLPDLLQLEVVLYTPVHKKKQRNTAIDLMEIYLWWIQDFCTFLEERKCCRQNEEASFSLSSFRLFDNASYERRIYDRLFSLSKV